MAQKLAMRLAKSEVPPPPVPTSLETLSPRELEVLSFAAAGYLDKQIGAALGLSLNTLRTYWARIRSKLGAVPRAALVAYFTEVSMKLQEGAQPTDWDWEMDLRAGTYRHREPRSRVGMDEEMSVEAILSMIHPEDLPGVRWLLGAAKAGQFTAFHYSARFLTKAGPVTGSAFVRVISDEQGPYLLLGQRIPLLDMRADAKTTVGYWGYDYTTDRFWADDPCCKLLGINPRSAQLEIDFIKSFEGASKENVVRLLNLPSTGEQLHIPRLFTARQQDGSLLVLRFDLYVETGQEVVERIIVSVSLNQ